MGLSGVRRGAAEPVLTYDFMDARTFRAGPRKRGEKKKKEGAGALPKIVSMATHHFH